MAGDFAHYQILMQGKTAAGAIEPLQSSSGKLQACVDFQDSPALDAFSRLRVSQSTTLFDSQTEYGLDTIFSWDCAANGTPSSLLSPNGSVASGGNSVGPRNADTRLTPITCSATNNHYAVLQSRQYLRYTPGFSQLIFVTGVFATNASYTANIVLRTSTGGAPSDTRSIAQTAWNIDKFDGTGPSGITSLDLTKTQILFVSAQWLGVGRVVVGFDINGQLYPAHQFLNANVIALPYTQTFNLPVRLEARTSGATTLARAGYFDANNGVLLETVNTGAGGTLNFCCASVQSEGSKPVQGTPKSQLSSVTATTVTTRRPVFSIRPSELYQGLTNRALIELGDYWLTAGTNSSIYEIVAGGILGGASWKAVGQTTTTGAFVTGIRYKITNVGDTNFTLIGASANTVGVSFVATGAGGGTTGTAAAEYSCAEYDVSATTITSGVTIITGEVLSGSGSARGISSGAIDLRTYLTLSKIDALTANQLPISVVCTSTSGNSTIRAGINWRETTV